MNLPRAVSIIGWISSTLLSIVLLSAFANFSINTSLISWISFYATITCLAPMMAALVRFAVLRESAVSRYAGIALLINTATYCLILLSIT
jgi:predicted Co/Zn/Cd cation transporter (cation efflux family)